MVISESGSRSEISNVIVASLTDTISETPMKTPTLNRNIVGEALRNADTLTVQKTSKIKKISMLLLS